MSHGCTVCFFFNDTATTEIYTLSLHDALPICREGAGAQERLAESRGAPDPRQGVPSVAAQHADADERRAGEPVGVRSEEHTSELQSRQYLVCRLLLEKKKR